MSKTHNKPFKRTSIAEIDLPHLLKSHEAKTNYTHSQDNAVSRNLSEIVYSQIVKILKRK